MTNAPKRARNAKRTRDEKKQAKQGETKQAKDKPNVRRNAARGDGIGPSTY